VRVPKNALFAADRLTNRRLHEVLPDGSWKGRPCVIVGGGPSLRDFDFSLLRGWRTIGINRAFERFEPTIIFSMDTRFLNWLQGGKYDRLPDGRGAYEKFLQARSYKVWLATYTLRLPDGFFIIPVLHNYQHGLRAFGTSLREGIGHGNNSGYAALNLAVCLGADPIYLLGFDCKHSDGQSHWHSGHPLVQREQTVKSFVKYFERAAMLTRHLPNRIVNLGPDSALRCWPKKDWREVLH